MSVGFWQPVGFTYVRKSPVLPDQGGKVCVSHRRIRPSNWGSVISFGMGWKSPLCLQVGHCPRLKGTIMWPVGSSWQLLSLSSNTDITYNVQDSAFGLIIPFALGCPGQRSWGTACMFDWILGYFWLRGSINQDIDIWMLMHFPVDPVMSVVTGVRVGSHRNKCLLLMWVFRLWCMSLTRTMNNLWIVNCELSVGDRCTTVKLEPTWTSTFLKEQWEADSDLKVINRWKEVSKEKPLWEDVSPQSCAVKTLWSQWKWLFFRNSVLCHKWESGWGEQTIDVVILPESLWQAAFEAHHTAVVLRLQVIVVYGRSYVLFNLITTGQDLFQQFTYWSPGANLGKKVSCSFKAVRGGSSHGTNHDWHSWHTARNPVKNKFILVASDHYWLRFTQYQTWRPLLLLRS